jgi:hypothetical protein
LLSDGHGPFAAVLVHLTPDSICFEDRRRNCSGTEPDPNEEADWLQHYNELCYRLLHGDTFMAKVLSDSAPGVSLLRTHPLINAKHVGWLSVLPRDGF